MKQHLYLLCVLVLFALLTGVPAFAQTEEPPTSIAIIMDASGSMQALIESGRSRIAVARDEIIAVSSELSPDVDASLWIYGHRLSQDDPVASCLDIQEIIPLGTPDPAAFASIVSSVNAIGYTPIARTLGMVYSSLPSTGRQIIVLMSDGEESCGGDPCEVAAELDARNIELRIHTIGFAADAETRAQLQCIAEVTGGSYFEARDTEGLRQALRAATAPITGSIAVVRSDGEIAAGISFSVTNSAGEPAGTVVGSGSFQPGDYTVTVNTEPPFQASVTVTAGETAEIVLPELGLVRAVDTEGSVVTQFPLTAYVSGGTDIVSTGTGGLLELPPGTYDVEIGNTGQRETITLEAGDTVDIPVNFGEIQLVDASGQPIDTYAFNVYTPGTIEIVQSVSGGSGTVLAGDYDVEVATTPPLRQSVTVTAGETTNVVLPGIGTLEVVDSEGTPVSDYSFVIASESGSRYTTIVTDGSVDLLEGTYQAEVQTNPPLDETVTITAGETTQIVLPAIGAIEIIDAEGNPTDEYAFYVYPEGGGTLITGTVTGRANLAAGTYDVDVYTNPALHQTVTVNPGETTQIQIGGVGSIQVLNEDGSQADEYAFYVYNEGTTDLIVGGFGSADINAGTYDVEVYTNPITRQTVTVRAGETAQITLGGVGTLEILDDSGALADDTVFYVSPEGTTDVIASGFGTTQLNAGSYDVEVYTNPITRQTITIEAGETFQLTLPPIGTIELVDASGNPVTTVYYTVYPAGSDEYAAYVLSGSVDVLEGDYEIVFDSDRETRIPVTVVGGETVEIEQP